MESVTVYGLLVAHNKEKAIPLQYIVEFKTNISQVQIGHKLF